MKTWIVGLFVLTLFATACHHHDHDHDHEHDHSGHDHSGHDHGTDDHGDHAHEDAELISYTIIEGNVELFVQFKPFVAGGDNQFKAILTDLNTFKPLDATLNVHSKQGTNVPVKKAQKGIFGGSIPFKKAGKYDLIFVIEINGQKSSIPLNQLPVAKDDHDVFHITYPNADEQGSIAYQREQVWQGNFSAEVAEQRPVGSIIHTSGIIQPASTDLSSIVAKRDGIVSIRKKNITTGAAVRSGELLFTVTGKGIMEDDLEMNFIKARSNLEQKEANLKRVKALLEDNIIGQKEHENAQNQFEVAEAEYNNIKKLYEKGAKRHLVTNPTTGFVSQLMVQEGQFVKAGQQLAAILKTSRVQIRVDVSPRYRAMLPMVVDANFVNPYNDKAYPMSELDGRVISFGRMTSHAEGHYIPMYFEINNHPDLSPGALIEAYLLTKTNTEQLCVPTEAVLEEMGSYVVFVQKSAETFEKQVVELGANDGKFIQIKTGLNVGDRVVTKGALQIKMASMAGSVDPHAGHVH